MILHVILVATPNRGCISWALFDTMTALARVFVECNIDNILLILEGGVTFLRI